MKNKLTLLMMSLFLISMLTVNAQSQTLTFNTTKTDSISNYSDVSFATNIRVKEIRQDPFPVNPGEYTDIYMKIENYGQTIPNPRFDFILSYPFTLDPSSDKNSELLSIDSGEKRTLHYKIRVDEKALPGNYEVEYRTYTNSGNYFPYFFTIKVEDVTSKFDLAVQDISKNGVTLGLANIGDTNAQSITLRLEKQEDFENLGFNSYIVGNLNAGDDTSVDIDVLPKSYDIGKDYTLKVFIDYTDTIGYRRTIEKDIIITMNPHIKLGLDELQSHLYGQEAKGNGFGTTQTIVIILILGLALAFWYFRMRKRK